MLEMKLQVLPMIGNYLVFRDEEMKNCHKMVVDWTEKHEIANKKTGMSNQQSSFGSNQQSRKQPTLHDQSN